MKPKVFDSNNIIELEPNQVNKRNKLDGIRFVEEGVRYCVRLTREYTTYTSVYPRLQPSIYYLITSS